MESSTPLAVPTADEVIAGLRECLAAALEPDDLAKVDLEGLNSGTPLLSLPLDSLALMALMTKIEDRFRVFIPEQQAFAFTKIGEVVDCVRDGLTAKAARRRASA